ncbi:MAG TPA: citramalate synthase, partial [Planctomycetota bacterium]|nr:citramalate synthase [Planctomycetota bacterium]
MDRIHIFDTTLRDGSQGEGVSFSLADKLKVLRCLDDFRVDYVEGGWPGSNPKDVEFFEAAAQVPLEHSKLTAFGSTCRPQISPADDINLKALLAVATPAVAIFGKSWRLHVTEVFRTTLDENLRMIEESVRWLKENGREVIYDAEHFFDGYKDDAGYATATLEAAHRGGADCLVLCDTNGGTLPGEVGRIVREVRERISGATFGIHTHNDSGVAVANSLVAVENGARHIQGTFNGLGERCGNADLTAIIPSLVLKLGYELSIDAERMRELSRTARTICAIANRTFPENHPFVGQMAFAHKGGVHVNSVRKIANSYEHVQPEAVGNTRRFLISELSGKSNIEHLAEAEGVELDANPEAARSAVAEIKELENRGYVFEGAEASATLILLKHLGQLPELFELVRYRTAVEHRRTGGTFNEATVKVRVQGREHLAVGEGVGPVDALDEALRNALRSFYPEVTDIHLRDYRVRIINAEAGTDARVCVSIESSARNGEIVWSTVGAHENLIEASWFALKDSIVYGLYRLRKE